VVGEADRDSAAEYDPAYEETVRQLEAELKWCAKCAMRDNLCLIDKHAKHRVVTAEMVRAWALALVSLFYLFFHY
jgi:hypothetical protein